MAEQESPTEVTHLVPKLGERMFTKIFTAVAYTIAVVGIALCVIQVASSVTGLRPIPQVGSEASQEDAFGLFEMQEKYKDRVDKWASRRNCSTCAIVLPLDTLNGRGHGPGIDDKECVVRFNGHRTGKHTEVDFGRRETIRILDNSAEILMRVWDDPCLGSKEPHCRRILMASMKDVPIGFQNFMDAHKNVEVLPMWLHEKIWRTFYMIADLMVPVDQKFELEPSNFWISLLWLREKSICEETYIYGMPYRESTDTTYLKYHENGGKGKGYANDPAAEHRYIKRRVDQKDWPDVHYINPDAPHEEVANDYTPKAS